MKDADLKKAMILALGYNAGVMQIATLYFGNVDDSKSAERCKKAFMKLNEGYNKQLKDLENGEI